MYIHIAFSLSLGPKVLDFYVKYKIHASLLQLGRPGIWNHKLKCSVLNNYYDKSSWIKFFLHFLDAPQQKDH